MVENNTILHNKYKKDTQMIKFFFISIFLKASLEVLKFLFLAYW